MTDISLETNQIYIGQGEYAIGSERVEVIGTLLGSCVSACLWDAQAGLGGMNHVVFSGKSRTSGMWNGYGVSAMEVLINQLMRHGAERSRLKAKVFGGAKLFDGLARAGQQNADFVLNYLVSEGISVIGGDLGGHRPRRVEFWPASGRARMKYVREAVIEETFETAELHDVELF